MIIQEYHANYFTSFFSPFMSGGSVTDVIASLRCDMSSVVSVSCNQKTMTACLGDLIMNLNPSGGSGGNWEVQPNDHNLGDRRGF